MNLKSSLTIALDCVQEHYVFGYKTQNSVHYNLALIYRMPQEEPFYFSHLEFRPVTCRGNNFICRNIHIYKNVDNYSHAYFIRTQRDYLNIYKTVLIDTISTAIMSYPYDRNIIYKYMQVTNHQKFTSPGCFVASYASLSRHSSSFAH